MLRCPMKRVLRFIGILALGAVALALVAALVVYSGAYNVSATSGHTKLVERTLNNLMIRSVRAHARDIVSPVSMNFRDPKILEPAAGMFETMCRTCHGAPGKEPDPWLLYPPAPDLAESLREKRWTDADVFWIIKYGIKDTAMGAFGGTHPGAHSDEEIWGMTALIRQFPSLSAAQYTAMSELGRIKQASEGGGHGAERQHQQAPQQQQAQQQPKTEGQKSGEPHKH